MSRTIARPKLVPHRKPDPEPPAIDVQKKAVPKSRSDVEMWNSTFPRRAWLKANVTTQPCAPQVRPAGHEREAAVTPPSPTVTQVLGDIERTYVAPVAFPGLCRTCVRLSSCTYPKPEGGVWHCDEHE